MDHLFLTISGHWGGAWCPKGEFDKYLTRPINPLFHILVETFQIDALGELWLVESFWRQRCLLCLDSAEIPAFPSLFLLRPWFISSLKIATASIAFGLSSQAPWFTFSICSMILPEYPISIYHSLIRWLISFIVPFAFTAYYPASYLLAGKNGLFNIQVWF